MKAKIFPSLFVLLWLFIGFVSSLDTYYTIKYAPTLYEMEENPIARYILEYSSWDVSLFIFLKMLGTIFVLGFIALVYNFNKRIAWEIIFVLVCFQIWLLL